MLPIFPPDPGWIGGPDGCDFQLWIRGFCWSCQLSYHEMPDEWEPLKVLVEEMRAAFVAWYPDPGGDGAAP